MGEKKRLLIINEVFGHSSTGVICADIADEYRKKGWVVKAAYGRDAYVPEKLQDYSVRIGGSIDVYCHALGARLFDNAGFGSKNATKRFLRWASDYDPDLIWLHNLHGYYINIEYLFAWLKSLNNKEIKWTLHDCWAFTGHCAYFSYIGCNKWMEKCEKCPQRNIYPISYFMDRSERNYKKKRKLFSDVEGMKLIVPSNWLLERVGKSFLSNYPISVQYNSIDSSIFKPTQSDFRKRYNLDNKFIVLGVANVWNERKGINLFCNLSKLVDDQMIIVLVGIDNGLKRKMPSNILCINRTHSKQMLAEIYSAANVFVNPSIEETFGMTVVEAQSCGTYVIVMKGSACAEIYNKSNGEESEYSLNSIYTSIMKKKEQWVKDNNLISQ
ncbi:MAG: glycosyltransferase [Lachnospiraceae bacterium]|nr:glycosyltransferase [Lachnospiraceae bacterium]